MYKRIYSCKYNRPRCAGTSVLSIYTSIHTGPAVQNWQDQEFQMNSFVREAQAAVLSWFPKNLDSLAHKWLLLWVLLYTHRERRARELWKESGRRTEKDWKGLKTIWAMPLSPSSLTVCGTLYAWWPFTLLTHNHESVTLYCTFPHNFTPFLIWLLLVDTATHGAGI